MNNKKIPTLIGVLVLVFGLAGGVVLVNKDTIFKLGASPEATPKDVRISNVTESSFTVSWITDKQTTGLVKWGETSNLGQTVIPDVGTKTTKAHWATVRNLAKNKAYYFTINSGGTDATNNGIPWNVTTSALPAPNISHVSGTVLLPTGTPADDAIVYINSTGILEQSTTTSTSGNWILTLPVSETEKDTLLNIYVQAGADGIATAQVYLGSSNPVPTITLGKTHDFLSSAQTSVGNVPESSVTLPTSSNESTSSGGVSRFNLNTSATPQPAVSTVTVKSIDNGETIYTTTPEFFGEGPKNTSITVTVHSTTPITQNVTVSSAGAWKWSPPTNLEDGSHTLTITWKDAKGVLQTLTKSFTVVANAQEPSFVSTPSGSLAPSPTATATVKPTTTATPTVAPTKTATASATLSPTVKASPTAKPTSSATPSALPEAGSPFATIAFMAFGLALILGSVYLNLSIEKS